MTSSGLMDENAHQCPSACLYIAYTFNKLSIKDLY